MAWLKHESIFSFSFALKWYTILFIFSGADNYPFQEFLASCNPNQQQAHTLESYLIKPIQRILKYPLLLQQLKSLGNI